MFKFLVQNQNQILSIHNYDFYLYINFFFKYSEVCIEFLCTLFNKNNSYLIKIYKAIFDKILLNSSRNR